MHTNPNPALNTRPTKGVGELQQRFFQDPRAFEADCAIVAWRVKTLASAFSRLHVAQPYDMQGLAELATLTVEMLEFNTRGMYEMAERMRVRRINDNDTLHQFGDEADIAIEWLLQARGQPVTTETTEALYGEIEKERDRRNASDADEASVAQSMLQHDLRRTEGQRDVAVEWLLRAYNRPVAPHTIEELREDITRESARRAAGDRFPDTAVAE